MSYPNFSRLQSIGLKPAHVQGYLSLDSRSPLGRVTAVDRGLCRVVTATGHIASSEVSHSTAWGDDFVEFPILPSSTLSVAVGDWVTWNESDVPRVDQLVERSSLLARQSVDNDSSRQIIAANVDVVFVVAAFSTRKKLTARSLNPRRMQRYIAAVRDGGALPVVVLNKADLAKDEDEDEGKERKLAQLRQKLQGTEVVSLSALESDPSRCLAPWLGEGETVAFVGSSGVGKSTLVNRLLGYDALATGAVRDADTKGRHTTTRRLLLKTADGTLVIDTPGMREFAVALQHGADAGFSAIAEFAFGCRFSDCLHGSEPGCAVQAAIRHGQLSPDELEDYRVLHQESLRHNARHDAYSRHLLHEKHRKFTKMVRDTVKKKPGRD